MPPTLAYRPRPWLLGGFRTPGCRDEFLTFIDELASAGAGLQAEKAATGNLAIWFRGTTSGFDESIAEAVHLYNGIIIEGVKRPA